MFQYLQISSYVQHIMSDSTSVSEELKRPQFGNRFLDKSNDDVFKHNAWYANNSNASNIQSFFITPLLQQWRQRTHTFPQETTKWFTIPNRYQWLF